MWQASVIRGRAGLRLAIPLQWQLGVTPGQEVALAVGRRRLRLPLEAGVPGGGDLSVGSLSLAPCRLPPGPELNAVPEAPGRVRVGPVVGVLTTVRPRRPGRSFWRFQNWALRNLHRAASAQKTLVFVFNPGGIRWESGLIQGYRLGSGRRAAWQRGTFPFPDVIYNRIPSRAAEERPRIRRLLARLRADFGPRLFNPYFLDKWVVYRALREDAELRVHLPATYRLTSVRDVERLVAVYPDWYLKPRRGSLGLGLIRVRRRRRGLLISHLKRPGYTLEYRPLGWQRARRLIRRAVGRRGYLVQQTVPLARYRGRVFDVRALIQKDSAGQWALTGVAARVAPPGGIATHVPNGGIRRSLSDVLPGALGPGVDPAAVRKELEEVARRVGPVLEQGLGETLGELSVDLGFSAAGRVWVIEANAKPFRFDEQDIQQLASSRLVQYCRYLAGFAGL